MTKLCDKKGHNFEPRYDEMPSNCRIDVSGNINTEEYRKLLIHNVYIHDICVRCGMIIEREQKQPHLEKEL